MHGHALGQPLDGAERDVLELVGHDVALRGEVGEDDAIVVVGARQAGRGLRRHALPVGREDVRAIPELCGGGGEHPPELSAAEDADRAAGG